MCGELYIHSDTGMNVGLLKKDCMSDFDPKKKKLWNNSEYLNMSNKPQEFNVNLCCFMSKVECIKKETALLSCTEATCEWL